jgi:hypothetical protein
MYIQTKKNMKNMKTYLGHELYNCFVLLNWFCFYLIRVRWILHHNHIYHYSYLLHHGTLSISVSVSTSLFFLANTIVKIHTDVYWLEFKKYIYKTDTGIRYPVGRLLVAYLRGPPGITVAQMPTWLARLYIVNNSFNPVT